MPVRETVTIRFDGDPAPFLRATGVVRGEIDRLERDLARLDRRARSQAANQGAVGRSIAEVQRLQAAQIRQNAVAQTEAQRQTAAVRTVTASQLESQRQAGRQRLQLDRQQLEQRRQVGRQELETLRQTGQQRQSLDRQDLEAKRQRGREDILITRAAVNEQLEGQRQTGRQRLQEQRQYDRQVLEGQRQAGRESLLINRSSLNEQLEAQRQAGRQRLQRQQQSGRVQLENLRQSGRERLAIDRQQRELERRRGNERLETQRGQGRRSLELLRQQGRLELAEFRRNERLARQADRDARRPSLFSRAGAFVGPIIPFATIYGVIELTRNVTRMSDEWQLLTNRVRLYTNTLDETQHVQQRLFDVSQETRVGLSATAQVYQRIAAANDTLGLSQERILGIVRTLNQAVTVSGVSAESANAALVQFGQGLASSELRGQELRAVLEQLPRLAQLISDDLGVTRGELLALGAAGELTANRIIVALERQAATLDREFDRITPTIGQSLTVLGNSLTRMVGQFGEATGLAEGLARAIRGIAEAIDGVEQTEEVIDGRRISPVTGRSIDPLDRFSRPDQAYLNRIAENSGRNAGEHFYYGFRNVALRELREFERQARQREQQDRDRTRGRVETTEEEIAAIRRLSEARREAEGERFVQGFAQENRRDLLLGIEADAQLALGESVREANQAIARQSYEKEQAVVAGREFLRATELEREAIARLAQVGAYSFGDGGDALEAARRAGLQFQAQAQREARSNIEAQLQGIRGLSRELERLRPEQVQMLADALQRLGPARVNQLAQEFAQAQQAQQRWAQTGIQGIQQMRDGLFDLITQTRTLEDVFQQLLLNLARSAFNNIFDQLTADLTDSLQRVASDQSGSFSASNFIEQILGAAGSAAVSNAGAGKVVPAAVQTPPAPAGKRTAPLIESHVTVVGNPDPISTYDSVYRANRDLLRDAVASEGGKEVLAQKIEEIEEDT